MLGFTRLSGSKRLYPKGDTAREAESLVEPMTDADRPSAITGFRVNGIERLRPPLCVINSWQYGILPRRLRSGESD